jgi:hypothetical protein
LQTEFFVFKKTKKANTGQDAQRPVRVDVSDRLAHEAEEEIGGRCPQFEMCV